MKNQNWIVVIIALSFGVSAHAQNLKPHMETTNKIFDVLNEKKWSSKEKIKIKNLKESLKLIQDDLMNQEKFKVKIEMELNADRSESQRLQSMSGGVSLERGTFPSLLLMSAKLSVKDSDKGFEEDISALDFMYEYHPTRKGEHMNHMTIYSFGNRKSNGYMDVDQRYEAGFGMKLLGWSKGKLIEHKDNQFEKLDKLSFTKHPSSNLVICDDICTLIGKEERDDKKIKKKEIDSFNHQFIDAKTRNQKTYAQWNWGMTLAGMVESERIDLSRTIKVGEEDTTISRKFKETSNLRIRTGPFLKFQSNHVEIESSINFTLPISFDEKVGYFDDDAGDEFFDARFTLPFKIKAKINKNWDMTFFYNYERDLAPTGHRVTFPGVDEILRASREYHDYGMTLTLKFK